MATRKVTVVSTQGVGSKTVVNSSASSYDAAFRNELSNAGVNLDNMKVTVKETRVVLQDGSQLPEGDFGLFLTPGKVKSGK